MLLKWNSDYARIWHLQVSSPLSEDHESVRGNHCIGGVNQSGIPTPRVWNRPMNPFLEQLAQLKAKCTPRGFVVAPTQPMWGLMKCTHSILSKMRPLTWADSSLVWETLSELKWTSCISQCHKWFSFDCEPKTIYKQATEFAVARDDLA